MIREHVLLNVVAGHTSNFEEDFRCAESSITAMPGYLGHALTRGIENPSRYLLLVKWKTLEDQTQGFRESADYLQWKQLLHYYYDPFPTVEHSDLEANINAIGKPLDI